MREILNYQIVTADSTYDLECAVKEHLRNGWQPFGSLSSIAGDGSTVDSTWSVYSQPMVMYGGRMED